MSMSFIVVIVDAMADLMVVAEGSGDFSPASSVNGALMTRKLTGFWLSLRALFLIQNTC